MRILLAGATGVIGRQAVPVLAAAGHEVIGLARMPIQLPDAEVVAVDALDRAAVTHAVESAHPEVIVHMLTAVPDPVDPKHLARLVVGGWGVAYMTGLAGASNLLARHQLDWTPAYSSWRDGLAADLGVRAP